MTLRTLKNARGQLTLFFATAFLIFITCVAFMVNVGLFVKAKINLQNAVDAAAWSGAAVQARNLSNIAYVNWAMRNVYKEWMFKTYVIGQLYNDKILPSSTNNSSAPGGANMDFRMVRFNADDPAGDFYNFPSTCLHIGDPQTANLCFRYTVPGIPRFASLGMVGTDATLTTFTDALVQSKSSDCAKRTQLNFMVANCWAYQTGEGEKFPNAPNVSCDRVGAWPKAFELALRIRNLEKLMNSPPIPKLCLSGSDCRPIQSLYSGSSFVLPVHERSIKSFWAAYRNLENTDSAVNLKHTFRLSELAPTPVSVEKTSMGGMLTKTDGPLMKYYVDLRVFLINYVSFFHVFAAESGAFRGTATEGQCGVTKMAIPVPGYPLGFYKNPEVLTYYAVQGEAEYTGMFNPFAGPTKLIAYAAAKPFGGRIGPMLFLNKNMAEDQIFVRPAEGNSSPKSYPYASALDTKSGVPNFPITNPSYQRGYPVPLAQNFWVLDETTLIGGNPGTAGSIGFAIPNLLYDFNANANDLQKHSTAFIQKIQGRLDIDETGNITPTVEGAGLYDRKQYQMFMGNMPEIFTIASGTTPITLNTIYNALERVSNTPTQYEALNYLIPAGPETMGTPPATPSIVEQKGSNHPLGALDYRIFAPLKGPDTFFNSDADVEEMFNNYLNTNKSSIEKFLTTLHNVGNQIHKDGLKSPTDQTTYDSAAKFFHENFAQDAPGNPRTGLTDCNLSIAGQFSYFFFGAPPTCVGPSGANINTLQKGIFAYWNRMSLDPSFSTHLRMYHLGAFDRSAPNNFQKLPEKTIMSAYFPGVAQGAQNNGAMSLPNNGPVWQMDRNYYSTKFIAVESLAPGSVMTYIPSPNNFTIFSEGSTQIPGIIKIENFKNKLNTNIPISTIKQ